MFRILSLLAMFLVFGCAHAGLQEFDEQTNTGTVEVPLCPACSGPYDYQVSQAKDLMQRNCGGRNYKVIRESTKHTADAWGSTYQYFWKFKCEQ